MPMDHTRYPADWQAISLARRESAGWACEWCGIPHGSTETKSRYPVVLTVAHLGADRIDGTPGDKHDKHDVRPENLAALCQACHLGFDRADHVLHAAESRRQRRIEAGQLAIAIDPETNSHG